MRDCVTQDSKSYLHTNVYSTCSTNVLFFTLRVSEGHVPPTKMQGNKSRRKLLIANSKFQG